MITADFSERYTHTPNTEVPAEYRNSRSVSILPITVECVEGPGKYVLEGRVYIADDLEQDPDVVQWCLEDLLDSYRNREQPVPFSHVYLVTDGCAA